MSKATEIMSDAEWEMEEIDIAEETGPEDYVFVVKPTGAIKEIDGEMTQGIKDLLEFFENQYVDSSIGKTLH